MAREVASLSARISQVAADFAPEIAVFLLFFGVLGTICVIWIQRNAAIAALHHVAGEEVDDGADAGFVSQALRSDEPDRASLLTGSAKQCRNVAAATVKFDIMPFNGHKMATVTSDQILACYEAALTVSTGEMRRVEAMRKVAQDTGMNQGNAGIYIDIVRKLIAGETYRTYPMYADQARQILAMIAQDFGHTKARIAAQKVLEHIVATEKSNGPQDGVREVAETFLTTLK